jgi:hypothetical protein
MKRALVVLLLLSCNREREQSLGTITVGTKPDPRFDEAWRALAARGDEEADVFYIEDDRGEGLMGRVRRAARSVPRPPPTTPPPPVATGEPDQPPGPEVASVIRANLAAVKACYLRITREGRMVSGRAILSFTVESNGSAGNVQVDAPAFVGTELPRCMSAEVQRWSFPRSKRGGLAVSYPFVFVGG